jgi:hypothetical protein
MTCRPKSIIPAYINQIFLTATFLALFAGCGPKEQIQFRIMKNIVLDTDEKGEPILKGDAVFYNPNRLRMKLKEIQMAVSVDGKKAAAVDQKPDLDIPATAEFSVPVEAHLSLKEIGLLDAVLSLFGGKKYNLLYQGYVRVRVHGVTVRVPINYQHEVQLKR